MVFPLLLSPWCSGVGLTRACTSALHSFWNCLDRTNVCAPSKTTLSSCCAVIRPWRQAFISLLHCRASGDWCCLVKSEQFLSLVTCPGNLPVKNHPRGLPWWRSGWESACQCKGHGFEPWSGRIPHAAERLGLWATITEPARLEPVLCNKRGRDSERPAQRDEEWPPLAAIRESPRTETKTQHSHK